MSRPILPLSRRKRVLPFFSFSCIISNEIYDAISANIDELLQRYPSAEVSIFGDFNVHNVEWLGQSMNQSMKGKLPRRRFLKTFSATFLYLPLSSSSSNSNSNNLYFAPQGPKPIQWARDKL